MNLQFLWVRDVAAGGWFWLRVPGWWSQCWPELSQLEIGWARGLSSLSRGLCEAASVFSPRGGWFLPEQAMRGKGKVQAAGCFGFGF